MRFEPIADISCGAELIACSMSLLDQTCHTSKQSPASVRVRFQLLVKLIRFAASGEVLKCDLYVWNVHHPTALSAVLSSALPSCDTCVPYPSGSERCPGIYSKYLTIIPSHFGFTYEPQFLVPISICSRPSELVNRGVTT